MLETQLSLFPDYNMEGNSQRQKALYQEHKNEVFGSKYMANAIMTGKYGFAKLKAYKSEIPSTYVTFSEVTPQGAPKTCVTHFEADYTLERLWSNADKYIPVFKKYLCVAEPDFSLKRGMSIGAQIANCFRNRALGFYFQEHGLPTIPCMGWSSTPSYEFCFEGYEKGGAVIVSTTGVMNSELSISYFCLGFEEMLKRVSPDAVILLGEVNDRIRGVLPSQLAVYHFLSERYKRFRAYGK